MTSSMPRRPGSSSLVQVPHDDRARNLAPQADKSVAALDYAQLSRGPFRSSSSLFTRCLICQTPFDEDETLEHLPRGERVAFDPGRRRLWIICTACKRWSLLPIESRWEALEELEKLVTDKARLLSQTETIALMPAGRMELVRVGRAKLA